MIYQRISIIALTFNVVLYNLFLDVYFFENVYYSMSFTIFIIFE